MTDLFSEALTLAANTRGFGYSLTRFGLITVLVWIGALKIYKYEADGIVHLLSPAACDRASFTSILRPTPPTI